VELPNLSGIDVRTRSPYSWFHGILSRHEAEALLANQPTGAFIVRVSERIWGYTISYAVGDPSGSTKHFLVEKIPEGYQFLGTNQVVHESLTTLVGYHEVGTYTNIYVCSLQTRPITSKGREFLLYPVGQENASMTDYGELFDSHAREIAFGRQ
jgi:SH2 domain-containing protein 4A